MGAEFGDKPLSFSGGDLTRKGEIIETLIEASRFRKQMRYAVAKRRYDLALQAADNVFALHEKAIRAFLKNAPPRRKVRPRSAAVPPAEPQDTTTHDAPSSP